MSYSHKAKTAAGAEIQPPKAPPMTRSRSQVATAYAPGALFTFEGGLGACLAIPDQQERQTPADISKETAEQIHLRVREVWQNWFNRASTGGTDKHAALPGQCLDLMLLREGRYHAPSPSRFELVDPLQMGYVPAPLAFVCNVCQRFRSFTSVKAAADGLSGLAGEPCGATGPEHTGKCRWRQLDVVFIHWSGAWEPPSPGRWEWRASTEKRPGQLHEPMGRCWCGSEKFYLRDNSPRIGQWFFQCDAGHKDGDSWIQNDPVTTELLGDQGTARPPRWRRMEPISYRASAVFYPHTEQFVVFSKEQSSLLRLLQEGKHQELAAFVAERYGMGAVVPTAQSMLETLRAGGEQHRHKVQDYESIALMLSNPLMQANPDMARMLEKSLEDKAQDWRNTPGLIPVDREIPPLLLSQAQLRAEFGSRYDPFTLAVEHEALNRSKLSATAGLEGRAPFVRFNHLDKDLSPSTEALRTEQQQATTRLMGLLGMAEIGLIREFDLCRFTHGFTRMSSEPLIEKNDSGQAVHYPVRLNLFPTLGNGKRPVYVVTQANEAIYVRLRPELVYAWLKGVGVGDLPEWDPAGPLKFGAHLLQLARPFGKYFSELHPGPASTYRYVYTLLHTYAHVFMKSISEYSGLDLGSLSEYLFPADMAFVVYRNGTTMDLGNLSALWRNFNNIFLEHLLASKTLMCGSGSLCDTNPHKPGACPDCVMVPETSCLASNQLLSRAVLRGGPAPREDKDHQGQEIPGFLDMAHAHAAA
ncbi:hypothetical protein [Polaromonas naphthalenivorans]|uniref:Uncharacterized protein n=1 Tax=Polaromonas naphthalenivorans (strain CJ2) TaxID=365044 RepID=A1VWE9_POLNA|nr:hypothetical protein [Polaromonas naphthalenivorans]ABM39977.1 conserved hypothetical protein [Polaromonas naphthalenivorans CJ2]